ncbi:MAG: hypothetical protein QOI06_2711 [Nocardioidaceae bacterium]|nr:hypothetical protein [Nocardioidaceae bacterium]
MIWCSIHSMLLPGPVLGPGTVDDLIADARLMGKKATQRMIMDWQSLGLMDYPQPQGGAGRGRGSKKALYSGGQRYLFRTLLEKRAEVRHINPLTNIPVYLWLYWGDDYVPLRQVRLALTTYVRKFALTSKERARQVAGQLVTELAHPDTSDTDRNKLRRLLSTAIHKGRLDVPELADTLENVFDPHSTGREIGPPGLQLNPHHLLATAAARQRAEQALFTDTVPDRVFYDARASHCHGYLEFLREHPQRAGAALGLTLNGTTALSSEILHNACDDLVIALGWRLSAVAAPEGRPHG